MSLFNLNLIAHLHFNTSLFNIINSRSKVLFSSSACCRRLLPEYYSSYIMIRTKNTSHQRRGGGLSAVLSLTTLLSSAYAFAPQPARYHHLQQQGVSLPSPATTVCFQSRQDFIRGGLAGAVSALVLTSPGPVWADEYGVETEAPTIYTGETVEVCVMTCLSPTTKRPLPHALFTFSICDTRCFHMCL